MGGIPVGAGLGWGIRIGSCPAVLVEEDWMRRAVLCLVGCLALGASLWAQETSLTDLHDKTVLLFTPHPDDDVFGAGGTIAL